MIYILNIIWGHKHPQMARSYIKEPQENMISAVGRSPYTFPLFLKKLSIIYRFILTSFLCGQRECSLHAAK